MYQSSFSWGKPSQLFDKKQDTRATQDTPTGGPSALEKAFWSNQFQPIKRRVFFNEEVTEDTILGHIRHNDYGLRMFDWGTAYGHPELPIRIDGQVAAIVASGRRAWATACMAYDPLLMSFALRQLKNTRLGPDTPDQPVDVLLDREIRDEVVALGRKRGWNYYFMNAVMPDRNEKILLDIIGGEENWRLFAYGVDSAYVAQMCLKLHHQGIRDALYEKACAAGWPSFSYVLPGACPVKLGGELSWRSFCVEKGQRDFSHVYETLFQEEM